MAIYYMRVEAVNIDYFVNDTHDISTIRGGGFLLLSVIRKLEGKSFASVELEKVSVGASIGIFKFVTDDEKAQIVLEKTLNYLNENTRNHATFVGSFVVKADKSFAKINEELCAKNRWLQYKSPTVKLPVLNPDAQVECKEDGIRPASSSSEFSESTKYRRNEGRKLRQQIYTEIMGNDNEDAFVNDLQTLSFSPSKSLSNRVCLIYIDGNKFTRLRDKKCATEEDLQQFDKELQGHRKEALREVIKFLGDDLTANNQHLRLETLMWGGDEIEWVVPAWLGWKVVEIFYRFFDDKSFDGAPFTHACGVIFGKHNTPIQRMRNLARQLADKAKEQVQMGDEGYVSERNSSNYICYMNLESFDIVLENLDDFIKQYYHLTSFEDYSRFVVKATNLGDICAKIQNIRSGFPRKKIYEIIHCIQNNQNNMRVELQDGSGNCNDERIQNYKTKVFEEIDKIVQRAQQDMAQSKNIIDDINFIINGEYLHWYWIAEIGDYLEYYVKDATCTKISAK